MESNDANRLLDALVKEGWAWRGDWLYAPYGSMWLSREDPIVGVDLRDFHDTMIGRAARIKTNMEAEPEAERSTRTKSLHDVRTLVDVLERLIVTG